MSERPPPRRISVIANPVAGSPRTKGRLPAFLAALRRGGAEVEVRTTEGPGHATELAREVAVSAPDTIVAVGGDGTLNEIVNGLPHGAPPLATLPLGTSSIFARELGIPFDPASAAEMVLGDRRRRLDTGTANGRRFLTVVGVGWDAHVVEAVARSRSAPGAGQGGRVRYLRPIAQAVLDYDFPELRARVDDEPEATPARLAFACNIRNYAAWFTLAPDAKPDDGLLDFVLVGEGGPRDYLRWAVAAVRGTLPKYREVDCRRGRTIRVETDDPVPYEVDGDPGGATPLAIEIQPAALEVVVP